MPRKSRTVGLTILSLFLGGLAFHADSQVVRPQMETTLKTAPPPAPVITAWGPKDKVATGETLWFQGTNLKRDLFVVTFGDRSVLPHLYFEMLPTAASTSTRIVVQTTAAMKTGVQTSTPLKVLHRGGAPVILDPDYHVIDRAARFNGISKWHKGETASHGVFTEGQVSVTLNNLDFANEGTGIYNEEIRLIGHTRSSEEPCPAPLQAMKKHISHFGWVTIRSMPVNRGITWKRDPVTPSRIVIYQLGTSSSGPLGPRSNVTASLISTGGLQCDFITDVEGYAPFTKESGCELPGFIKPIVDTSKKSLVTFSLRRAI